MTTLDELLQRGIAQHRAGQFAAAEACYRQILAQMPQHADAHFLLGTLATQVGQHEAALHLVGRALELKPDTPAYYFNLGNIYCALERYAEAVSAYDQVLRLNPHDVEALKNKAQALRANNQFAAAADIFTRLLALKPDGVDLYVALADVYFAQHQWTEAVEAFTRSLELQPDNQHALIMLAQLYITLQKPDKARKLLAAIKLPKTFVQYYYLGNVFYGLNMFEGAIEAYQGALNLKPEEAEILTSLAEAYFQCHQFSAAIEASNRALALQPDNIKALIVQAKSFRFQGRYDSTEACYRRILALKPDDTMIHSSLLFLQSYHVRLSPRDMLQAHMEWDRIHGEAGRRQRYMHLPPTGSASKRLRIGYVSPDFRRHSVSYFVEPILQAHDRDQVEVYCYAEVRQADEVTARLQLLADHWYDTVGRSDEEVARRINNDGIDILVDLAGHTGGNRLGVFSYKPAPIQVSYLGYFTGTGLAAMDYWLTDKVMSPPDTEELTVETNYRLERCCISYQAPQNAPEAALRPTDAAVTFGSFTDLSKLGPRIVPCWSEILRRVPDSTLIIKAQQLNDVTEQERLLSMFAEQGIAADRLQLHSYAETVAAHLALYGEVDVALDSMPRTGGTTTAEALWMGVPVVSLAGARFIERLSASMLTAVGLEELVVTSEQGYIDRAVALAADAPRRQALRLSLRKRMAASPLCDAESLTRVLEGAYRQMWLQWSSGGNSV